MLARILSMPANGALICPAHHNASFSNQSKVCHGRARGRARGHEHGRARGRGHHVYGIQALHCQTLSHHFPSKRIQTQIWLVL